MPTHDDAQDINDSRPRRATRYVIAATLAAAIIGTTSLASGQAVQQPSGRTFKLIERDASSAFGDTGARAHNRRNPRFSGGDLHVFTSTIFNETNVRIGRLFAHCVAVRGGRDFTKTLFRCGGTFVLRDGTIAVDAAFAGNQDDEDVPLAVTGGTGAYEGARGSVQVRGLPRDRMENTVHLLP